MKTLKLHHLFIAGSLLLTSCSTTISYLGDQYDPTSQTDVYYDVKDIKQSYKVIGHLSTNYNSLMKPAYYKDKLSEKAKAIGADGVIILQTTGNSDHEMLRADAIKYNTR